jgi:hypothetical protein
MEAEPATQPLSCAELVSLGSQHLLINDIVANIAAVYLYRLLHRQPITSFLTFTGIDPIPTTRSIPIEKSELLAYLQPAG